MDSDADRYIDSTTWLTWILMPYWLKIECDGTTFTGYYSEDGSSWTELGSATIDSVADV